MTAYANEKIYVNRDVTTHRHARPIKLVDISTPIARQCADNIVRISRTMRAIPYSQAATRRTSCWYHYAHRGKGTSRNTMSFLYRKKSRDKTTPSSKVPYTLMILHQPSHHAYVRDVTCMGCVRQQAPKFKQDRDEGARGDEEVRSTTSTPSLKLLLHRLRCTKQNENSL